MSAATMLSYLSGLAANNNREWYHAHKAEYQEANGQFEALIQDLIFKIGETDGSILHNAPKDLTFRLVRDTRFSHDKSPYNPAFFQMDGTGRDKRIELDKILILILYASG